MPTDPVEPLAAELTQAILAAVASGQRDAWAIGVVTDVVAGAPTVTWNGGTYTPRCNRLYTPVPGDLVLMARPPDQLVVVCPI